MLEQFYQRVSENTLITLVNKDNRRKAYPVMDSPIHGEHNGASTALCV